MSERILILGDSGTEKLALAAGVSPSLVRTVRNSDRPIRPQSAYKLAKACGCTEEDARMIQKECELLKANRTA